MSLNSGERQVAPTVAGIRADHVARYRWAASVLKPGSSVIDVGCGIGYGARILAEAGLKVYAIDVDRETITYACEHYAHQNIQFVACDVAGLDLPAADAAVCFEMIEHVADPLPMLRQLRERVQTLLASVPNEEKFPWQGYAFHHRHYTKAEFARLLKDAGFQTSVWCGQAGPESPVEVGVNGRTLVALAVADEGTGAPTYTPHKAGTPMALDRGATPAAPEHVAILGLGPSLEAYVDVVKRLGNRRKLADEVWAINALGDVIQCDRVFHMDDVRVQEVRARARPESNIAAMLEWLRTHPGPIYTSRAHPDYPGLVEFPLEEVINSCGIAYFNSTAAYAVAYAVHIGVKKITLFGIDYTMPDAHHAEKGRGCVEFHLGIAKARGIVIGIPDCTSLLDSAAPFDERMYGYDTLDLQMAQDAEGHIRVTATPREEIVTAEEVERRYDHSRHPNPLVQVG